MGGAQSAISSAKQTVPYVPFGLSLVCSGRGYQWLDAQVAQVFFGARGVEVELLSPGQVEYAQPGVHSVSVTIAAPLEGEREMAPGGYCAGVAIQ